VSTGSLRRRVTASVLGLLLIVIFAFGTVVTLTYRKSREDDLRHRLAAGGAALRDSWDHAGAKQLVAALHLEGINVFVQQPGEPVDAPPLGAKPGDPSIQQQSGSLLTVHVRVNANVSATLTASSGAVDRDVRRLEELEALVAAAILLIGAIGVWQVTRVALRPLDHVANVAERIAAGEVGRRLRPSRSDTELGRMATAFDRMVDALQEALDRSRASEAATRRFLADASHELRTPIARLQATTETLLREQPARPDRDALEARLAGDSARLGRLVADLLDLARLDGAGDGLAADVDLGSVTRAALDEAATAAGGVHVDVTTRATPPVRGDSRALTRVLRNLLENAAAAAAPGGRIQVTLEGSASEARVRVVDDGPGVPAADRERIFERFVRLESSSARPGSGLGLAIARAIARQHGGDLRCDSVAGGASFTLVLPAASS
jgi:two-component system OmpR family sensor kinase